MLEISGNAQVKQEDDVFRAQQITLNLETQNITLSGNVKGSVTETKTTEEEPDQSENEEQSDDTEPPADTEQSEFSELFKRPPVLQEGGE